MTWQFDSSGQASVCFLILDLVTHFKRWILFHNGLRNDCHTTEEKQAFFEAEDPF